MERTAHVGADVDAAAVLQVAERLLEEGRSRLESSPESALVALQPLASALADLDGMLAEGGPWLDGPRPSVADLMLLPFLERTEAAVPYFFGEDALERAGVPFGRAAAYLRHATRRHAAFAALRLNMAPVLHLP